MRSNTVFTVEVKKFIAVMFQQPCILSAHVTYHDVQAYFWKGTQVPSSVHGNTLEDCRLKGTVSDLINSLLALELTKVVKMVNITTATPIHRTTFFCVLVAASICICASMLALINLLH